MVPYFNNYVTKQESRGTQEPGNCKLQAQPNADARGTLL